MDSDFDIYEDPSNDGDIESTLETSHHANAVVDAAPSNTVPAPVPPASFAGAGGVFNSRPPLLELLSWDFAPPGFRDEEDYNSTDIPLLLRASPPEQPALDDSSGITNSIPSTDAGNNGFPDSETRILVLESTPPETHSEELYERMLATIARGDFTADIGVTNVQAAAETILMSPDSVNAELFLTLASEQMPIEQFNDALKFSYQVWCLLKDLGPYLDRARSTRQPRFPNRYNLQRALVVMHYLVPGVQDLGRAIASVSDNGLVPAGTFA